MIFNIIISGLALTRYTERNTELSGSVQLVTIPTLRDKLNAWLDLHFDDERMSRIYPNAKVVVDGLPQKIKQ